MKKFSILFLFVVFFFTLFLSSNNYAYADFIAHTGDLQATVSCSGTNNADSTITFSWSVTGIANYNTYFWKTGDSSETQVTGETITQNVSNNTTYDWYIKVKDSGFCLYSCENTTHGSPITSLTCPPSVGTCTSFTYSAWGNCSAAGTQTRTITSSSPTGCTGGNPILSQSCTNLTNIYDCERRDPRCPVSTYPTCTDFSLGTNWSCQSPNCAMQNTSGNDPAQWTKSCAYSKVQPPPAKCFHLGYTFCSNGLGGGDNCCASENLICQAPAGRSIALGDGTCIKAPSSLGQTCNTCLPKDKWDSTKNSCVDQSGNNSNPVSSVYCNTVTQTCTQGQGCIETFSADNGSPAPPPCASKTGNGKCLYVNTGLNNTPIGTDPQSLIQSVFGLILSISGGIALLLIIISGYRMLASQGNPEALKGAREQLTAAIVGLLFIIFALVILQVIGVDILHIPGFK